jgi:S-adenosylmethionine:tRNA ribosyltransferase-isomerase
MMSTSKRQTAFEKLLAQYDYAFPESAVALEPSEPRDAARLLAYDGMTGAVKYSTFAHLLEFLPPRSLLVMNETKVIPARVEAVKATGGKVRLLYVADDVRGTFRALADRPLDAGTVLTVGAYRLRADGRVENGHRFSFVGKRVKPLALFMKYGKTPIPPYLKHTKLSEKSLRAKYQTVFARTAGSVAAPTASLHFTKGLLARLRKAGHEIVHVTLHVNLGTFAPLTPEAVTEGRLHEEKYEVSAVTARAVARAKKEGRRVIPVGTTALRALESAAAHGLLDGKSGKDGDVAAKSVKSETRLFIRPGYRFRVADGLITNFHVPRSSLLMLVAALIGREKLLALYADAIANGFRVFSFGDGMLLLPKPTRAGKSKK